ncbi:MAG TPA: FAD-dependent oxidoreductase [Aldersonia sp.]
MSEVTDPVVIVGAGHGGTTLAALLRQGGFTAPVVVVGEETHLPYHRPPLSKKFSGPEAEQALRPEDFYAANAIDLRRGISVTAIDRSAMRVSLSDGSHLPYRALVLATGSTPRPLPVPGASGVLTLRTLDDARALGASLGRGGHLAIVGGGYVGMEVAAVARSHGIGVTIVERERRILARVASAELSRRLSGYHIDRGTEVLVSSDVAGIRMRDGRACGVELADGRVLDCDTVLVGIGAAPNDALARDCGLACGQGVLVDGRGRTSDHNVYAIGDVAIRPVDGGFVRLESIPNATEQARQVAAALLGAPAPEPEVPWFWSDQFDLKLKIAGLLSPADRIVVREGSKPGSFALFHLSAEGSVRAVETANAGAEFMASKKFIAQGTPVRADVLGDPSVSLREALSPVRV